MSFLEAFTPSLQRQEGSLPEERSQVLGAIRATVSNLEFVTTERSIGMPPNAGPQLQYYLGQIQLFPYNFAPLNWAFCEGQLLPIPQNLALFAALGTTYGGDGQTTFALPDLRGKEPLPTLHYCIAILEGIPPSEDSC